MNRRPRIRLRDLIDEALEGVLQRTGRSALTTTGVVLGVGAFVTVLGLTSTVTGQISKRFTALMATEVVVEDQSFGSMRDRPAATDTTAFPADAEARVRAIDGVLAAGVSWSVPASRVGSVTGSPAGTNLGEASAAAAPVIAATPGIFDVAHATLLEGRTFAEVHDHRAMPVVVLGAGAARGLNVSRLDVQPVVFLSGVPMSVLGIIDDVERMPELLTAVIVPRGTAESYWGPPDDPGSPPRMLVETRLGAAQVVAGQAAVALRPDGPELLKVTPPVDPRSLRDQVGTDLAVLFLLLAAVCLIIGAVGIANITLVAVLERVAEIGLRRALGATRRHIVAQFLVESGTLGTLGGLLGTSVGVLVVVSVAVAKQWTPVIEPTLLGSPLIGTLVGLLAGAYPAIRASRIEPAEALRR